MPGHSESLGRYNIDAEQSALGACLVSGSTLAEVARVMAPEDCSPESREAFLAMLALQERDEPIDPISVVEELRRRGHIERPDLLVHALDHAAGTTASSLYHARIVRELAAKRRALAAIPAIEQIAKGGVGPDELAGVAEQLLEIARDAERLDSTTQAVDGASWILDAPTTAPAIWGEGEAVMWAQGESLLIVGPAGVGKTTLAQQLALGRLGLRDSLLGYPIAPESRRVLYIAADRPAQAARSLARMVTEADRQVLQEGLVVWRGPLPFDVAEPHKLAGLTNDLGVGTVIIDSLKDIALDLSKDEAGSRVNYALQMLLTAGVEVVALHHQRKASADNRKPNALADVYGSTWLTAGAGSVVLLWGEAGDSVVELSHLKQPSGDAGPLKVIHDHHAGASSLLERPDVLAMVRKAKQGLTAVEAAQRLYEKAEPTPNQVEKARRRLDALTRAGLLHRKQGKSGAFGGTQPTRWYPASLLEPPE